MNPCCILKKNLIEALDNTITEIIQAKLDSGDRFELTLDDDKLTVTFKHGKIIGINGLHTDAYSENFLADVRTDIETVYGVWYTTIAGDQVISQVS